MAEEGHGVLVEGEEGVPCSENCVSSLPLTENGNENENYASKAKRKS